MEDQVAPPTEYLMLVVCSGTMDGVSFSGTISVCQLDSAAVAPFTGDAGAWVPDIHLDLQLILILLTVRT